jgi:hypothetical protein
VLGALPAVPSPSFSRAKVESRIGGTDDDGYRSLEISLAVRAGHARERDPVIREFESFEFEVDVPRFHGTHLAKFKNSAE